MRLLQAEDGPRDPDAPLGRDEFLKFDAHTGTVSIRWVGGGRHPVRMLLSVERIDGAGASVLIDPVDLVAMTNELRLAAFSEVAGAVPETVFANFVQANADLETALQARR